MREPTGRGTMKDRVIVPEIILEINSAANCEIPQCASCNMSSARQRKTKVVKSKVIQFEIGSISRDKYVPRDFFQWINTL